jgi:predicted RecA/RadA family phage recombinase
MPQAQFVHEGRQIDYTPGSAVAAGDVIVQGEMVCVANKNIEANRQGALCIEGAFDFTALNTDVIAVGALVYWDDTNNRVTTTASGNKKIGPMLRAKANGELVARARLSPP